MTTSRQGGWRAPAQDKLVDIGLRKCAVHDLWDRGSSTSKVLSLYPIAKRVPKSP